MIRGMLQRWLVAEPHPQAESLARALRVSAAVGQVLARRGIDDPEQAHAFLTPTLNRMHDPRTLPGIERAAERMVQAVRDRQTVALYGDYDVDGITAVAILYHTLKALDAEAKVLRYIPHRIDEGYGLNGAAIEQLADHQADLIVTVDCGVTAYEPAEVARQRGVDLIITDHHALPTEALPQAYAIVHPRLHEADASITTAYPFGELCGAGVAYKLAWQIARAWYGSEKVGQVLQKLLVDLLALAALGTVADVVPLHDENRAIVTFGLGRIKHTPFAGLNALIDASRLRDEKIDAYHCGFTLGPRLNACGRMGHARKACHLLTTAQGEEAKHIAEFLNSENERRRAAERKIAKQARQRVEERGDDRDDVRAIVLGDSDWHAGVIGIVASRLVDRYHRPTVLFSLPDGSEGNGEAALASGSARSIDDFNMIEALHACAEHLESYGGHAMAAGMKCAPDRIEPFRQAMIDYAAQKITVEQLTPTLELDGEVTLADLTTAVVEQLERLAPFGRGNRHPAFLVRTVQIAQPPSPLGREGRHLAVLVRQGGVTVRCLCWQKGEWLGQLHAGQKIDLAARPKLNAWAGRKNVELEVLDLRIPD